MQQPVYMSHSTVEMEAQKGTMTPPPLMTGGVRGSQRNGTGGGRLSQIKGSMWRVTDCPGVPLFYPALWAVDGLSEINLCLHQLLLWRLGLGARA